MEASPIPEATQTKTMSTNTDFNAEQEPQDNATSEADEIFMKDDFDPFPANPDFKKSPERLAKDKVDFQVELDLRQYVLDHADRFPGLAERMRSNDPDSVKPLDHKPTFSQASTGFPTLGDLQQERFLQRRFSFMLDVAWAKVGLRTKEEGEVAQQCIDQIDEGEEMHPGELMSYEGADRYDAKNEE